MADFRLCSNSLNSGSPDDVSPDFRENLNGVAALCAGFQVFGFLFYGRFALLRIRKQIVRLRMRPGEDFEYSNPT